MTVLPKPLPDVSNPLTAPFWASTKNGDLKIPKCKSCGNYQFPPREMCAHCQSLEFDWVTSSGEGKLVTYCVINRPPHPAFQDDVPYAIVVVELSEGVRMLGASKVPVDELKIGMAMAAEMNKVNEDVTLVNWARS